MTKDSLFTRLRAAGAVLLLAACNSSTTPPGPPIDLVKTAGDGQSWYFDNPLPTPLSVMATDPSGRPVPGVLVTWTVTSGGVNPAQSTTDASGIATTSDSVGASTLQTVSATFTGLAGPATFSEFATTPPTSAGVTVGNNVFTPGSVVVQTGGTVTWTWNPGGVTHNVTFTAGPGTLPPPAEQSSGTHDVTFTTVGQYAYHCTIHPTTMSGTVTVVH
jgi:plastocyanin